MADWKEVLGGITAPKGYRAAGITAGLKPSGLPDLALILSDVNAIAAGVFTLNQVCAAPVTYCRQRLQAKANASAILVNAGQANAATGVQGLADAEACAGWVAEALNIPVESVLLASTGVIGQRIRMEPLEASIPTLVAALSDTGSEAASRSIMTTDTVPKTIALEMMVGDRPLRIGGITKGSGMIHPNMATMLAFITCDAAVSPTLWQQMLSRAVNRSFNQVTVDGDTSTNDTVIALANGQSRTPAFTEMGEDAERLEAMLTEVCIYLAKAIARDGEGATCLLEVQVSGAETEQAAAIVARTIASSSLVKSAIFGNDPNWGRIAGAAGRAGVAFDQENLRIQLGDFVMMDHGQPQSFDRVAASTYLKQAKAGAYLKEDTVAVSVSIGDGNASSKAWGCDLSYDYVKINADYTT